MTTERLELLNSVNFIWDSHDVNWREKLDLLVEFRNVQGHCNVPSNFLDKRLATWIKCQRRQYKLYWDGKPSAMTPERIFELEKVGFEWEIRSTSQRRVSAKEARLLQRQAGSFPPQHGCSPDQGADGDL
jgi:Helicase associated domain